MNSRSNSAQLSKKWRAAIIDGWFGVVKRQTMQSSNAHPESQGSGSIRTSALGCCANLPESPLLERRDRQRGRESSIKSWAAQSNRQEASA